MRTNQAKTGGMHGDEWCAVNLAKDGRSEIGAAGDALTILIKFKCVARFALVRFNNILVCLEWLYCLADGVSDKVSADLSGYVGLP